MKLSIPSRSSSCSSGHAFAPDAVLISELFKNEDGSWRRKDTCLDCYTKDPEAYCSWRSTRVVQRPTASPLLESFRNSQEMAPRELYFLTELLLRQRQLLRRSRSKSELVVEDAVTGELYKVAAFELSLSEVKELSVKF